MPAESVTVLAVAFVEDQTPTSTTIRSPVVIAAGRVAVRDVLPDPCAVMLWTNCGAELGVVEFDGALAGPAPTTLVADTVKV